MRRVNSNRWLFTARKCNTIAIALYKDGDRFSLGMGHWAWDVREWGIAI
ncbi:MAG: hypothetical protein HWQ37_23980 [Nostoc sp. NMS4]|nr:hypothetical protein [Nostoc sp. NMS4]